MAETSQSGTERLSAVLRHQVPPVPISTLNVTDTPTVLAAPTTVVAPLQDERGRRIEAFVRRPITAVDESRFSDMKLTTGQVTAISDWPDESPGPRSCYNLIFLSDQEVCSLGTSTFTSLKSSIQVAAIGNLLLLAYNLKDNAGRKLYGEVPSSLIDVAQVYEFDDLPKTVLKTVVPTAEMTTYVVQVGEENLRKLSIGYSYLAASYMRLYTKTAQNYTRIESHLKDRFENFYDFALPFDSFHPELEAVKTVKATLDLNSRVKNTFYNFLYAGESVKEGKNIKDFLYGRHTSYTGLHSYCLFMRCMTALKVTNRKLSVYMYCEGLNTELMALKSIFNVLTDQEQQNRAKQMWKYARIFEPRFLSPLQTKNCKFFTLVLAYILHQEAREMDQDVFKIAQLENMSEHSHLTARAYASRVIRMIKSEMFSGNAAKAIDLEVEKSRLSEECDE